MASTSKIWVASATLVGLLAVGGVAVAMKNKEQAQPQATALSVSVEQERSLQSCMAEQGQDYRVVTPLDAIVETRFQYEADGVVPGSEPEGLVTFDELQRLEEEAQQAMSEDSRRRSEMTSQEVAAYDEAFLQCTRQENANTANVLKSILRYETLDGKPLAYEDVNDYVNSLPQVKESIKAEAACFAGRGFPASGREEFTAKYTVGTEGEDPTRDYDAMDEAYEVCTAARADLEQEIFDKLLVDDGQS